MKTNFVLIKTTGGQRIYINLYQVVTVPSNPKKKTILIVMNNDYILETADRIKTVLEYLNIEK